MHLLNLPHAILLTTPSFHIYIVPPSFVFAGNAKISAAIAAARHPSDDSTTATVDEVKIFETYRIINAPEAVFRIFGYPLVTAYPAVTTLSIILPGNERVYFNPNFKTGSEALAAYHTDPEKYFLRPAQLHQVPYLFPAHLIPLPP